MSMDITDKQFVDKIEAKKILAKKQISEKQTKAITDKLDELKPYPFPEKMMMELPNVELITLKGEKGDKGDQGDVGPQGEQGIEGPQGKTGSRGPRGEKGSQGEPGLSGKDGLNGKDGLDGIKGKDGSPDTPKQIVTKLHSLKDDDRLDRKAVKGLDNLDEAIQSVSFLPRTLDSQYDVSVANKRQDLLLQYSTSTNKWHDGVALTISLTAPSNPQIGDVWIDIS